MSTKCSVCGVDYSPLRRGMCRTHYRRLMRNGTTDLLVAIGVSDEVALIMNGWSVTSKGCWEWSGKRDKDGYGCIKRQNKDHRAHRVAYTTWVGPIPTGLQLRHRCDNPPCINPDHLEPGTAKQNVADMNQRGRGNPRHGETHPYAVLTDELVRNIRERVTNGGSIADIARELGVKYATVRAAAIKKTWRRVT